MKFSTLVYVNAEQAGGTPQPKDIVSFIINEGGVEQKGIIVNDGRWPIIIGDDDLIQRDVHELTFIMKG